MQKEQLKTIKDFLKNTVRSTENVCDIPNSLEEAIHALIITSEERKVLLGYVSKWKDFIRNKPKNLSDFELRILLQDFASECFSVNKHSLKFQTVSLENIFYKKKLKFTDLLKRTTSLDILNDSSVAIFGGVARTALKLYAKKSVQGEVPFSDIDLIVQAQPNLDVLVKKYGGTLEGTKIVSLEKSLRESLISILSNEVDCTMNQCGIYNGELFFTQRALQDVQSNHLCMISSRDPLFEPQVIDLPNGNTYLTKTGINRAVGYLSRGKAKTLIVSKENLDAEKGKLGRHYIISLTVKLSKITDVKKRNYAVQNWFRFAQEVGSTDLENPTSFLQELVDKHPEMKRLFKRNLQEPTNQQPLHWLVTKLIETVLSKEFSEEVLEYPQTYTPVIISTGISEDSDLDSFWKLYYSFSG